MDMFSIYLHRSITANDQRVRLSLEAGPVKKMEHNFQFLPRDRSPHAKYFVLALSHVDNTEVTTHAV